MMIDEVADAMIEMKGPDDQIVAEETATIGLDVIVERIEEIKEIKKSEMRFRNSFWKARGRCGMPSESQMQMCA